MSVSAATLLLPAPDTAWRVWKPRAASPGDAVDHPSSFTDTSKPLIIGLPASACRTLGLILPQSDESVLEQMIIAQLEKRGIKGMTDTGRNFRWHQLGATGPLAVISVDVLADPFPDQLAVPHAADYTAALRLSQLPSGHLVIVEEQGDAVLAAGHQGRLFHSHIIGPMDGSTESLVEEINLSRLSLEAQAGFGLVTGVTLAGSWDRKLAAALSTSLGLPVEVVPQLAKDSKLDTRDWTSLLPPAVREAQASARRRAKFIRIGVLASMAAAALVFLGFSYLQVQEKQAAELAADVEKTAPAAAEVKKTAEHWKALSPAIEQSRFLLVQLNDITALMPPSGIVIRRFEAKTHEIEIRGEARDAQTAFQFLEDIKKHRNLGRYEWSMPQPSVREKTASFRAQGKLKS
ncbi:MAG: hypothetical protein K1X78_22585 [Verrucomicrobiaceae bacterium]|nr:hypothetical protein [Verrucomicrobiaceae bacterium]